MDDLLERQAEKAEADDDLWTAVELWRRLAVSNPKVSFLIRYGWVAAKLERWKEAEDAFSKALHLDSTSSSVMENMASLWAHRSDKNENDSFNTAKQWFQAALKLERNARLLTQLGATCLALGDKCAASSAFEEAIQLDPYYEEALYNLAVLNEKTDPQKSTELLKRAVQIDPDYAIAYQALGRLFQKAKDLVQAEYHFRRSLEIDPADYWSNIYMANLFGVQGRNMEAEQTYRFVTSMHPEVKGGIDLFAHFLDSIGKTEEASKIRTLLKPNS